MYTVFLVTRPVRAYASVSRRRLSQSAAQRDRIDETPHHRINIARILRGQHAIKDYVARDTRRFKFKWAN